MSDKEETVDFAQKINQLQEREREILKKMNTATRAGASFAVMQQLQFMLEECKTQQHELKILSREKSDSDNFDDFLSIG
jgi:tRNA C32,U32 (ribose-2'-O)-methylase TrmJ